MIGAFTFSESLELYNAIATSMLALVSLVLTWAVVALQRRQHTDFLRFESEKWRIATLGPVYDHIIKMITPAVDENWLAEESPVAMHQKCWLLYTQICVEISAHPQVLSSPRVKSDYDNFRNSLKIYPASSEIRSASAQDLIAEKKSFQSSLRSLRLAIKLERGAITYG